MLTAEPTPTTSAAPRSLGHVAAPRSLGHVAGLDGLRAVAVLLVVVSHTWIVVEGLNDQPVIGWFTRGAFLGVDVFFVLSGFLITSLLLGERHQRGRVSFVRFYVRRATRLLPALYLMLLAAALYAKSIDYANQLGGPGALHLTIRNALTYTSNWQAINDPFSLGDLGQLWSLAIEEQFYIVWPAALVVLLAAKRETRVVVGALIALILAVAVWRAVLFEREGWNAAYHGTTTRSDGLLIGSLLGVLWVRRLTPSVNWRGAAWAASAVALAVLATNDGKNAFMHFGGFTIFNLAVAVVVLAVVEGGWSARSLLTNRTMQAIGRVSYGIYLWHLPLIWALRRWDVDLPDVIRFLLAMGATAIAVAFSWFVVERPAQRWRRRFEVRRAANRRRPLAVSRDVRRFSIASASAVVVAAVPYLYVLWNGRWDPLRTGVPERYFSSFFELQARALARFRWNVPEGTLGIEAFVVDGRTYTYFPPFPSLVRAPVLAFTDRFDGRLTAPSILLAWLVTAAFTSLLVWRVRGLVRPGCALGRLEAVAVWLFMIGVLAGSSLVFIGAVPWVYHEPFAWGVAGSVGAMFGLAGVIERPGAARIWFTGAMTLVAVWSRTTMGWGCVGAVAVTAAWLALRRDRPARAVIGGVALAGAMPFAAGALVTYQKFGQPFMHPLSSQVWTGLNAQRRAALEANGGSLLGPQFLPSTLQTYLRPDGIRFTSLYPWITLPARPPSVHGVGGALFDQTYRTASITAFMPLLVVLAALGIVAAVATRRAGLLVPIFGAGLATGGVLLYGYIGNRYVADFMPLLIVGGAVGLVGAFTWLEDRTVLIRRSTTAGVAVLAAFGVYANTAVAWSTVRVQWGGEELADHVDTQRRLAIGSISNWVSAGPHLPLGAPADELFIVGECDGLYAATGEPLDPWVAVELRGASVDITMTRSWDAFARYRLVRLSVRPEIYLSVEGDGGGRVRALLEVPFLTTYGQWIEPGVGDTIALVVKPSTRYHRIAVSVDDVFLGAVPTGNWDERGYRDQATPTVLVTEAPAGAPFDVTDVTTSGTPTCDELRVDAGVT